MRDRIMIKEEDYDYILENNIYLYIWEFQNEFCILYFSNFFESNRI